MSFKEELVYPTKLHNKEMLKYRVFFDKILDTEVVTFGGARCLANNQLMIFSDSVKTIELFADTQGYSDSPFLQTNIHSGYKLVWDGYSQENTHHNIYQHTIHNEFGVDLTFIMLEKHLNYNQYFCFDVKVPERNLSLQDKKNFVIQDFMNNMPLINACLEQFQTDFLSNKKILDLFTINIGDVNYTINSIKKVLNKDKIKLAIESGILTQDDLNLKDIHLTSQEEICLDLYIRGIPMHEVATKLILSPRTVENYLSRIKEKFGVTFKGDLFQKFRKLKLIKDLGL